ncbi:Fe-S protein [Salmonella enterica subsp. enterica]|uniref:Fe-S protein n=1 Tax=Salmonella enterica I TaxID=59201 RepID=A0A447TP61_SALET|nr:Fe-S protein [Salmonella enterica subsp. enterica]
MRWGVIITSCYAAALKKLGEQIQQYCGSLNFRPFVDSAPILERPLAEKAGLGWTGKHSLILNRGGGLILFPGGIAD